MINSIVLIIHITSGSIGILSGMIAMFLRKGAKKHKNIGSVFFISMLLMCTSATYLAFFQPYKVNIIAGLLTLYMVITAWRTAYNSKGDNGRFEYLAALFALGVIITGTIFGIEVLNKMEATGEAMPLIDFFIFFFTAFGILGFLLDIKVIVRGGIYGAQRIARHLWRTCFALYVATSSLFLGQPQVFPEFLSDPLLRSVPVILVIFMLFFWLIRVYTTRRFKSTSRSKTISVEPATVQA